jgi:hypothetical protein
MFYCEKLIQEAHTRFLVGKLEEGDHLEAQSVDGMIILKWIFQEWNRGHNWIDLVRDRGRWRILANAVMNLRVP